jgi:hypothetical protein
VNKNDLKLTPSNPTPAIDWAIVDAAPLASMPDDDSPELTALAFDELRPPADLQASSNTLMSIMLDKI